MLCWVAVGQPYDFSYSFERTRKSNQQHPQKYRCKSLQSVHKVASQIRTLLVHWIYLLSSTYIQLRVIRVEKDWDLKKIGERFQVWTWYIPKILQLLMWIAFPGKNHLILSLLLVRNVLAFESSTKFCFQLAVMA